MKILLLASLIISAILGVSAQVPLDVQVTILKAEDSRNFGEPLLALLEHKDAAVRSRAALAAGRIGDAKAVPALVGILFGDDVPAVRVMAVFALGEIESADAADAVYRAASDPKAQLNLRARAVEAAGKIAAANVEDARVTPLKESIVRILAIEHEKRSGPDWELIRAAATAALRARPEGADAALKPFVGYSGPAVVADVLNALARLRAKNVNEEARKLLSGHADPVVRANAARVLGAAEDKGSIDLLVKAAVADSDARVRVSAIRSLAQLGDAKAAVPLMERGEALLSAYKGSKFAHPTEKSEMLEIAAALGRLLPNSDNEGAVKLLQGMLEADGGISPEIPIARLRVSQAPGPGDYPPVESWRPVSTMAQVISEISAIEPATDAGKKKKAEAPGALRPLAAGFTGPMTEEDKRFVLAAPDVLTSYAKFKTDDLAEIARGYLAAEDVWMRVAAAGVLADLPSTEVNISALKKAFDRAFTTDTKENDAQLAILDALFKLDKKGSVETLMVALNSPDHLVRGKAFTLLEHDELKGDPEIAASVAEARKEGLDRVLPHKAGNRTKVGQVLNTDADYRRAASRRNGTVKAVLTTEKGSFTIDLLPENAPLTVDNFIKLANAKYFDGLEVHRVVPNFVMQDGDPIGNGSGGPGWSIRCEINMVPYGRGAVGMALSGKDTGGSQWFVTHSPQPHLDGGYTVFGRVNETDMKVVDSIVRGDKILTVKVVEGASR